MNMIDQNILPLAATDEANFSKQFIAIKIKMPAYKKQLKQCYKQLIKNLLIYFICLPK